MEKTILVTGAAGFVGSHLCEYLLNHDNCQVIGLDNLLTGQRKNIEHLLENKNFKFILGDIVHLDTLKNISGISQIYNLACPASPVHYQANSIETIQTNTVGVMNLLEMAKNQNARILQASTSEVYGDPKETPQKETYNGNVNPIGPRACYDEGKRIAETLFFEYHRKFKTEIRVARIFNTYGPKMAENDGRVISNFIVQALKETDITVYGDGAQTRSFCYVSDLVAGLYKLMNGNIVGPVNLGNPGEMTMLETANKILEMTGSKSKIVFRELPKDDPSRREPDISLAKKELGWEPKVPVTEGLQKTIEYFKNIA